jgi:chromate transporter
VDAALFKEELALSRTGVLPVPKSMDDQVTASSVLSPFPPSLSAIARAFLYIGFIGFGGGLAILAQIQRHVVEKLRWLTREELAEATAVVQSLPGVIAVNISCFIGFKLRGWKGGLAAVVAIILPAFLSMLLVSEFYLRYKEVPDLERLFRGLTPAIAAFILVAAYKLGRGVIRSFWDWPIALFSLLALSVFSLGVVRTVLITGTLGILAWAWKKRAAKSVNCFVPWLSCLATGFSTPSFWQSDLWRLIYVFLKIGAFTFGGGYVMVPILEGEVVKRFGWLSHREFVDSVALGQITPGPVVITATFVGYKVLGLLGACLATVSVFFPSYCLTLAISLGYQRFKSNQVIQAFLRGVAPSVVGMLASATWSIGKESVHSWLGVLIAVVTVLISLRSRISSIWVLLGAGCVGLLFG